MAERMIPGVWYRSKTFDVLLRKENMPEIVDGVLTIPDEVTTIDAYSFNDCPPFRELIVPENVLYIESNEKLLNCPEFRKITFLNRDGRMRFLNYHRDKSVPEVLTYRIAKTDKYTVFLEGEPPATDESEICIGAEFHSMNHRGLSLMKICIEGKNGVYGSGFTPVEARRNLYLRLKNDHSPEQYNGLTIESTVQWEEAVAMVDIILERCEDPMLMDGLAEVLSEKEYWSVSEIIEKVNRCGISNNDWFASVFGVKARSNSWLYGAPIPKE